MTDNPDIDWTCGDVLTPFFWENPRVVRVLPDLFEPETRETFRDRIFAAMAMCPQHRFFLRTAYPDAHRRYVDRISNDRSEYLAWRVSAAQLLRKLGRADEATGDGPEWPLPNVTVI